MTLDHYVSQTHLRAFYSPAIRRLFAVRKSDLKEFPPKSEDVCRVDEGSTNNFLSDARAIEAFLLNVEPHYNAAVTKIGEDKIDRQSVYVIAGFAAYVMSCSPAAIRLSTAPLRAMLHMTALSLDKKGKFGKPPSELGGSSFGELLNKGTIEFSINEKYPQAIGISTILQRASTMGNSPWTILVNRSGRPYFTSDFPVAFDASPDGQLVSHIIPIAPDLAVAITPDRELPRGHTDLSFAKFSYSRIELDQRAVDRVNDIIVKSAEDLVFSSVNEEWVLDFVRARQKFRIEVLLDRVPRGEGHFLLARKCLREVVESESHPLGRT